MVLYGISNCDTVRKARKFLEANQLEFKYHDFRKDGLDATIIQGWLQQITYQQLINKRSTTWKTLSDTQRQAVEQQDLTLLVENPTLIKRPVLVTADHIYLGFDLATYQSLA